MQLGVKISDKDMQVLRDTLPRTKMYDETKAQMQKGLDGYRNDGEAWDFESLGLQETIQVKGENIFPSRKWWSIGDFVKGMVTDWWIST